MASRQAGRISDEPARSRRGVVAFAAALAVHALALLFGLRAPRPEAPVQGYLDTALDPIDLDVLAPAPAPSPAVVGASSARPTTASRPVGTHPHRAPWRAASIAPIAVTSPDPAADNPRLPGADNPPLPGAENPPLPGANNPPLPGANNPPLPGANTPLVPASDSRSPAPVPSSAPLAEGTSARGSAEYSGPAPAVPGLPSPVAIAVSRAAGQGGEQTGSLSSSLAGADVPARTRPLVPLSPGDLGGELLRADLRAHDHALGIDTPAGGAATTTAESAVRSQATLIDAKGTLDVRIGSGGRVESVRVTGFTGGDAAAWARVATAMSGALAGRTFPARGAGPGGAVIHVSVDSKLVYPAGNKAAVEFGIICAADPTSAATPPPAGPGPFIAPSRAPSKIEANRKKGCIPAGVGLVFDLANIGTHRSRQVHAHYSVDYP